MSSRPVAAVTDADIHTPTPSSSMTEVADSDHSDQVYEKVQQVLALKRHTFNRRETDTSDAPTLTNPLSLGDDVEAMYTAVPRRDSGEISKPKELGHHDFDWHERLREEKGAIKYFIRRFRGRDRWVPWSVSLKHIATSSGTFYTVSSSSCSDSHLPVLNWLIFIIPLAWTSRFLKWGDNTTLVCELTQSLVFTHT